MIDILPGNDIGRQDNPLDLRMMRSLIVLLALDHDILFRERVLALCLELEEESPGKSRSNPGRVRAADPTVKTCGASAGAGCVMEADAAAHDGESLPRPLALFPFSTMSALWPASFSKDGGSCSKSYTAQPCRG